MLNTFIVYLYLCAIKCGILKNYVYLPGLCYVKIIRFMSRNTD